MLIRMITGIFSQVLAIVNKLLCFLHIKRGRKTSGSLLPTHVTPNNAEFQTSLPSNNLQETELQSWDTWGKDDVDNVHPGSDGDQLNPDQETDFFKDMVPAFKKNPKIVIKPRENFNSNTLSSRLAVQSEVPSQGAELGSWEETEGGTWGEDEDLTWDVDSAIREKKQQERQQRMLEHQMMKKNRDSKQQQQSKRAAGLTAVKLTQ